MRRPVIWTFFILIPSGLTHLRPKMTLHRNQPIGLLCKLIYWLLYDGDIGLTRITKKGFISIFLKVVYSLKQEQFQRDFEVKRDLIMAGRL